MRPREVVQVVGVSAYMLGVATWLRVSGRVKPERSLAALCRASGRARLLSLGGRLLGRGPAGELTGIEHSQGHCFSATLPWWSQGKPSDSLAHSSLILFEDGRRLGPPRQAHVDIAALGAGRFSHWNDQVYFSSSDNTDPRDNGRRYTFEFPAST